MRKLVRVTKVLEEAEDEGLGDRIYVDPDDIVQLEEDEEEEE